MTIASMLPPYLAAQGRKAAFTEPKPGDNQAVTFSRLPGGASQRQGKHTGDREGQKPPGRDSRVGEDGGRGDRKRDAGGGAPVVSNGEVPPEARECGEPGHAGAADSRRLRIRTTAV